MRKTVYVDHAIAPHKKSYQDMADELNQYKAKGHSNFPALSVSCSGRLRTGLWIPVIAFFFRGSC